MSIQRTSLYPVLLRMEVEETNQKLSLGTGFVYEYKDYYYLITNGHNVTGVNPESNTRINKEHAGFPTCIRMKVRIPLGLPLDETEAEKTADVSSIRQVIGKDLLIRLYTDESSEQPNWYIHPVEGYQVDVIAISLGHKRNQPHLMPINSWDHFNSGVEPGVADDVFILGYPFGITDPAELPVWKKGSIATEPFARYKGLPALLVDTASRSGMSGSPVIFMRTGVLTLPNKELFIGTLHGFLGIYSGRIGDVSEAQLGIVWRGEVIEEILSTKVLGTTAFQRV